jgi:hypothetical protein
LTANEKGTLQIVGLSTSTLAWQSSNQANVTYHGSEIVKQSSIKAVASKHIQVRQVRPAETLATQRASPGQYSSGRSVNVAIPSPRQTQKCTDFSVEVGLGKKITAEQPRNEEHFEESLDGSHGSDNFEFQRASSVWDEVINEITEHLFNSTPSKQLLSGRFDDRKGTAVDTLLTNTGATVDSPARRCITFRLDVTHLIIFKMDRLRDRMLGCSMLPYVIVDCAGRDKVETPVPIRQLDSAEGDVFIYDATFLVDVSVMRSVLELTAYIVNRNSSISDEIVCHGTGRVPGAVDSFGSGSVEIVIDLFHEDAENDRVGELHVFLRRPPTPL